MVYTWSYKCPNSVAYFGLTAIYELSFNARFIH